MKKKKYILFNYIGLCVYAKSLPSLRSCVIALLYFIFGLNVRKKNWVEKKRKFLIFYFDFSLLNFVSCQTWGKKILKSRKNNTRRMSIFSFDVLSLYFVRSLCVKEKKIRGGKKKNYWWMSIFSFGVLSLDFVCSLCVKEKILEVGKNE